MKWLNEAREQWKVARGQTATQEPPDNVIEPQQWQQLPQGQQSGTARNVRVPSSQSNGIVKQDDVIEGQYKDVSSPSRKAAKQHPHAAQQQTMQGTPIDEFGIEDYRDLLEQFGVKKSTKHDKLWRHFIEFWIVVATIVIWLVLGVGNAMLFTGFQDIHSNTLFVIMMYIFGPTVEGITMALIFVAAFALRDKNTARGIAALSWAIILSLISFACQWLFIVIEAKKNEYDLFTTALVQMHAPIPVGFILFMRALVPSLITFALVFILPEKSLDYEEAITEQKKMQHAVMELRTAAQEMELREIRHQRDVEDYQRYLDFQRFNQQTFVTEAKQQQFVVQHHQAPQIEQSRRPKENAQRLAPSQESVVREKPKSVQDQPTVRLDTDEDKIQYVMDNLDKSNAELAAALKCDINGARFWRQQAQLQINKQKGGTQHAAPIEKQETRRIDPTTSPTSIIAPTESDNRFSSEWGGK